MCGFIRKDIINNEYIRRNINSIKGKKVHIYIKETREVY